MIGFLIINYNDAKTTKVLLENIKNYNCLDKILVVDNCSSDNSYEELKSCQKGKIEVIRNDKNGGYGAGINFGLKYLEHLGIKHTFISNSDIVIYAEEDLKKIIKRKDLASILAPVIKEHTGLNRGWKIPKPYQLVLQSLPFVYRIFMNINRYPDDYYVDALLPVEVVSFCFFFVSILDFKEVDYFDEKVFLYYEENIMACKLKNKKTYLCNDSLVFHNHSKTIDKNLNRARKYKALSKSKRYFAKYYGGAGAITLFLLWFIEKLTIASLLVVQSLKFGNSSNHR